MSSRQYSINHYQDDQYLSAEEGDDDYHTNPLGNDSRSGIDAKRRCLPAAPPATKHQTERTAETTSKDVCTRNGNYEKEMTGKTLQRNDNFDTQLNNYQLKTASSETMAYYRRWKNFAGDPYAQDKFDNKIINVADVKCKLKKIPEEFYTYTGLPVITPLNFSPWFAEVVQGNR